MEFGQRRMVLMPEQIGLFDSLQNRQKVPSGGGPLGETDSARSYLQRYHLNQKPVSCMEGIQKRQAQETRCFRVPK